MNFDGLISFILLLIICHTNGLPVSKESGPNYLYEYGYLSTDSESDASNAGIDTESLKKAIKLFQYRFGLEVNGELDSSTLSLMSQPRCGDKDVHVHENNDTKAPVNFRITAGEKWKKGDTLKYKILDYTNQLSTSQVDKVMRKAFDTWSRAADINFRKTSKTSSADITIRFARREHGDGYENAFDGEGNVLAHAFYPTDGRLHFDDDETWTANSNTDGTNLLSVAIHEIGHNLGLDHSNVGGSIMYPFITDGVTSLHDDDINGVQKLYGRPKTSTSDCPWLTPTNKNNVMKCKDGTTCNIKSDPSGFSCCKKRRGRAQCPKNKPMMCKNKRCDSKSDHCCSSKGCKGKYGGPKRCSSKSVEDDSDEQGTSNHCCAEVVVESNGKAGEKHGKKLGRFFKFGNSKNNRFSYRHENGDSYLYWQKGVWMVGPKNGNDYGQILSRDESLCPEEATGQWKYWSTSKEEWDHDSTLATKCNGEKCCNQLVLSSNGGTKDNQENRLGKYIKYQDSDNGRLIYKKLDSEDAFLYWMNSYNGIWMVGSEAGKDHGQVLNGNHATCPESISSTWKYWSSSENKWNKDMTLTVECDDNTDTSDYADENEDSDYNNYGDYFYTFDFSEFSNAWFSNLGTNG